MVSRVNATHWGNSRNAIRPSSTSNQHMVAKNKQDENKQDENKHDGRKQAR
jgi:hypothetical protein